MTSPDRSPSFDNSTNSQRRPTGARTFKKKLVENLLSKESIEREEGMRGISALIEEKAKTTQNGGVQLSMQSLSPLQAFHRDSLEHG